MPGASTLSHLGEIFGSLAAVLPNLRQCWSSKLDSVLFILYLLYPLSKLTSYLLWGDFDMETLAISLLALMRSTPVAPTITSRSLNQLKADIKHKNVPQPAIAPIFDVTRLALGSSDFLDAGLSTLSHMIKRLQQQDQLPILETQARRTIPQGKQLLPCPCLSCSTTVPIRWLSLIACADANLPGQYSNYLAMRRSAFVPELHKHSRSLPISPLMSLMLLRPLYVTMACIAKMYVFSTPCASASSRYDSNGF